MFLIDNKCPNCGYEDHNSEARYCTQCGVYLKNTCTNIECDPINREPVLLMPNDKFCPYCGAESSYKAMGHFDK